MSRSRTRRNPRIVCRTPGKWRGLGPIVYDAVTGWKVPLRFTVEQRGGRVDVDYDRGGSRDRPKEW